MDRAQAARRCWDGCRIGRGGRRPGGGVDGTAFVHALHVLPDFRRLGVARNMMRRYRLGARPGRRADRPGRSAQQCRRIALHQGFGMAEIGGYHYRKARA